MNWPLPADFNEAVQFPATAFRDPDLSAGQTVVGPTGLPLPRSGNFADVYQLRGADSREWAVKCFTRPVVGLDKRYERVTAALTAANLPFTIPFTFLSEGVRVSGRWLPAVKMQWVDGLQLNQFVRENVSRPAVLDGLFGMWVRLCSRLREAGLAHADLQHGNVLLVPGAKPGQFGLRLIDYDGLYAPALANVPSGELGHPAYQHPGRAAGRVYSPDLDRFPHLVVATALKGLTVAPHLWDRYDTGDNLLFVEADFQNPAGSKLLKELWATGHPAVQGLVGRLVLACGQPIPQTPWLDHIAPDGKVQPLPPADAHRVMATLGYSLAVPKARPDPLPRTRSPLVPALVAVAAVFLLGGGLGALYVLNQPKPEDVAKSISPPPEPDTPPTKAEEALAPKVEAPPAPVEPVKLDPPPPTPDPPKPENVAPKPPDPPKPAPPPELKPTWTIPVEGAFNGSHLVFAPTGKLVWIGGGRGCVTFDPRSGRELTRSGPDDTRNSAGGVSVLEKGGVGVFLRGSDTIALWDTTAGKTLSPIDAKPALGMDRGGKAAKVSPNGRYLVATSAGGNNRPGSLAIYDTTTKKVTFSAPTRALESHFTADSTRLLVPEVSGRFRWYKLPAGDADGEFTLPLTENTSAPRGTLLSDDGGKAVVFADLNDMGPGVHLIDTKTGQLIASHTRGVVATATAALDGGRLFAFTRSLDGPTPAQDVEIHDTTGKQLARIPVTPAATTGTGNLVAVRLALSDDGRRLAMLNPEGLKLSVYELPEIGVAADVKPKVIGRLPVPPDAAITFAVAEIRTLFKDDYARRTAADRKALAAKLATVALGTKAAAEKFALLREARDLYAEVGEVEEAVGMSDRIAELFDTDADALADAWFEKLLASLTSAGPLRELAEAAVTEAEKRYDGDRFAAAVKVAQLASAAARKANSAAALADAEFRLALAKKAEEAFAPVRAALDKLKDTPADPEANLTVGRFRYQVQRRWDEGLPHLAKCGDAVLAKLAADDLKATADASPDLAVADGWWEYARTAPDADRPAFEARARHWYFRLLDRLEGIDRKKVEAKLAFTLKGVEFQPGLAAEFTAKTPGGTKRPPRVDPVLQFKAAEFEEPMRRAEYLVKWAGVILPPKPGRYRLVALTGDPVRVRVNGNVVIDTTGGKSSAANVTVTLTDQPNPLVVEAILPNTASHGISLVWSRPGSNDQELIPAEFLFHPKQR
jgi:hypothetical protein